MFCCLTASAARALLCMADAEFRIQKVVEAVVACPESEHCHLFQSCCLTRLQFLDTRPSSLRTHPIATGRLAQ